jgi:hypothetical protein
MHYTIARKVSVFGMADHGQIEYLGVFQGPSHKLTVHDCLAVVADRYSSCFFELCVFGQHLTLLSPAYGSHGKNSGQICLRRKTKDEIRNG